MVVLDNDRPGSIVLESFWISHKHAQLVMAAMENQPQKALSQLAQVRLALALSNFWDSWALLVAVLA